MRLNLPCIYARNSRKLRGNIQEKSSCDSRDFLQIVIVQNRGRERIFQTTTRPYKLVSLDIRDTEINWEKNRTNTTRRNCTKIISQEWRQSSRYNRLHFGASNRRDSTDPNRTIASLASTDKSFRGSLPAIRDSQRELTIAGNASQLPPECRGAAWIRCIQRCAYAHPCSTQQTGETVRRTACGGHRRGNGPGSPQGSGGHAGRGRGRILCTQHLHDNPNGARGAELSICGLTPELECRPVN